MIEVLLSMLTGYAVVRRLARRRRDHVPRATRLILPAPMSYPEAVHAGAATFGGDCAWCGQPYTLCDRAGPPCQGQRALRARWSTFEEAAFVLQRIGAPDSVIELPIPRDGVDRS